MSGRISSMLIRSSTLMSAVIARFRKLIRKCGTLLKIRSLLIFKKSKLKLDWIESILLVLAWEVDSPLFHISMSETLKSLVKWKSLTLDRLELLTKIMLLFLTK